MSANKKKIISVVGARPNFMKIAPIYKALRKYTDVEHLICHTGQHYDEKMSKIFFDELELPKPDFYLGVNSGSMTEQTATIMIEFEKVVINQKPDLIIVVGDVTSTLACSLVAQRFGIPKAHIEAGLRSFDRTMPEEINRILTDAISDLLFVTEKSGVENLKREGIPDEKVFLVGNVMIDSLLHYLEKAKQSAIVRELHLQSKSYTLVTLHRPSNVDSLDELKNIVAMLNALSKTSRIVFPIHPRTRKNLELSGLFNQFDSNVTVTEPIGYIDFLSLIQQSSLIITDSGGIQEETTFLGVQCLTARENTERPCTVEVGTNQLIGTNWDSIYEAALQVLSGKKKTGNIPELWDGKTAERISKILQQKLLY